jgi:hypothetical protein
MKKRLFQILDEMNVNDDKNKTETVGVCPDFIELKQTKQGGIVTMGIPVSESMKVFTGEKKPVLLLIDMKEYNRIENVQVSDTTKMP